ncbi:MAG TPA: NADH-ubiquinone oxidoreductase-F iron-sulfur binding region domain-containing protein [Desulfuromonadaceae bacterium]|jgi:bidirectional [NiFe] hydrogenase diaphorase subunit
MTVDDLLQKAHLAQQALLAAELKVFVCLGSPCIAGGAEEVLKKLRQTYGCGSIHISGAGCMGPCSRGPVLRIQSATQTELHYEKMSPQLALLAVESHLHGKFKSEKWPPDLPFVGGQQRIVLSNCGSCNPEDLESALAAGGYHAFLTVIKEKTPEQVCTEIKASGLRGRGGAGYSTGIKWELVRKNPGKRKYVVANGDEGDPGAFMDRTLMESDPHRLLEGMAVAGYAVGAGVGFIYVRAEYPLAAGRLRRAINEAEKAGLLGQNILGSKYSFRIKIRIGAGAFVCGEETALMASVMGRRGQPSNRPPYPSQKGLWGRSTLINNVETFGCIAPIIEKGAAWFRSIGTPGNSGSKVFSISGDVATVGVLEVPLGTSLRKLLKITGGMTGGVFKAALSGGSSGGCLREEHLDIPLDYDSLEPIGTMLGSGGLIIMNHRHCMVDLALFFMRFSQDESCGKCTPCRIGTVEVRLLLERITSGRGIPDDLKALEQLCQLMQDASLCGLGQAAPNPVISTLRWFRSEYEEHIRGHCPAGICMVGKKTDHEPSLAGSQEVTCPG